MHAFLHLACAAIFAAGDDLDRLLEAGKPPALWADHKPAFTAAKEFFAQAKAQGEEQREFWVVAMVARPSPSSTKGPASSTGSARASAGGGEARPAEGLFMGPTTWLPHLDGGVDRWPGNVVSFSRVGHVTPAAERA